jgi:2-oxoglutarate dehydrogenase E2 component (dihydrolipoamide succinyltransferase)
VHSVFEVDCSRIEATRQARKAEFAAAGARLSVLPFVLKAAASALREFPILNSSLDGDQVVYHSDINVGVAVALDAGLIVPVIRHADRRTLLEISLAIGDLADRARSKQFAPEDVTRGTFTVTNRGNRGGSFATPIINQPQVAILELGTVEQRVAVVNDDLEIRSVMNLTLGFDHRLIDGAVADRYLSSVTHALELWNDGS